MTPTLLLDLDVTLLQNNIDTFLPRYLELFSKSVSHRIAPDIFIKSLMAGTQAMVDNRQPDITLKDSFETLFYPLTRIEAGTFQAEADHFYNEVFPALRSLTSPIDQAVQIVRDLNRRGYRLAIATNPLFPRIAILQRLDWAGLSGEQYDFELISSYETFHFAKPNTAYFAEVMARMGWPDGPVIMVGDDLERDILPARKLGLSTYWVQANAQDSVDQNGKPIIGGPQENLLEWLERELPNMPSPDYNSMVSWLAIMRSTPAVLDSIGRVLPDRFWNERFMLDEWSLTEIICHLRDVDGEVNLPRIEEVILSANPFLPGQDTDPWAEARQYRQQDGRKALSQFISTRRQVLNMLEALEPQDWQRPARHAIFGPTCLQELVNILASHDRLHIQQVHKLLAQIPIDDRFLQP